MTALYFSNCKNTLNLISYDITLMPLEKNECLIRVLRSGICNTDLEILKGYISNFEGVLGHEFVGIVERCGEDVPLEWINKRICADINVACGQCTMCTNSNNDQPFQRRNHCLNRTCIGVRGHNGCFATHIRLPVENLHVVPDNVSDALATFAEPLAAALRPLEQGLLPSWYSIAIIGDGKLGWLLAEVFVLRLRLNGCSNSEIAHRINIFGRHPNRSFINPPTASYSMTDVGCRFFHQQNNDLQQNLIGHFDAVIEASGSPSGLPLALKLIKPQGRLILKTTVAPSSTKHEDFQRLFETIVVNEISVYGSRCGPIDDALSVLSGTTLPLYMTEGISSVKDDTKNILKHFNLIKYISSVFPLTEIVSALKESKKKGILKVQIKMP